MPEGYEVTSVREITDVDSESGDLLDYVEASAKSQPHGVTFTLRFPSANLDPNAVSAALAAKAAQLESIFG